MKDELTDEDFFKKYGAFENQSAEEFLAKFNSSKAELRELIDHLIQHRQLLRDAEIECLEREAQRLVERLKENKVAILVEEIDCLKDILALQKERSRSNDEPRY